jgi:hypothetical protein
MIHPFTEGVVGGCSSPPTFYRDRECDCDFYDFCDFCDFCDFYDYCDYCDLD